MSNDEYEWNGDPDCCLNCGYNMFECNYATGTVSCLECGCCRDDVLAVVDCTHKDRERANGHGVRQESYPNGAVVEEVDAERIFVNSRRKNSPPYKRETYFSERISQWRLLEPEIDSADWQVIERMWEDFTGKWKSVTGVPRFKDARWSRAPGDILRCNLVLTKEMCRELLWAIDDRQRAAGIAKPIFVKKYLVSHFNFCCFFHFLLLRSVIKCHLIVSASV